MNLIFYNFPEAEPGENEDCEQLVHNIINSRKIFDSDSDVWIDRAHRLGPRKPQNNDRPRPIIVKFAYYKQKNEIIRKGHLFKGCTINVSEDFSWETLAIHKDLWKYGQAAKSNYNDNTKSITYFKVSYRRLVLTYTCNKNDPHAKKFTRSFSIDHVKQNSNWYVPPVSKPVQPDRRSHTANSAN